MKIALACHNFPPEFRGGTERVVEALARALAATHNEVLVITGSEVPHRGRDVEHERWAGIDVYRIPRHPAEVYGLDMRRLRVLNVVEDLLIEKQVDVLHVHHWSTLSIRLARSARVLGIGAVVTLHDLWTSCGRFFRRPPPGITCPAEAGRAECVPCGALDLRISKEQIAVGLGLRDREIQEELGAASLVAPSRACAEAVMRHVPHAGPIDVIAHGLLEPVTQRHAGVRPGRPLRVGTFGNLVRDKGVLLLVEAMAGVAGAELHLFGTCLEPGFERELRDAAAAGRVDLTLHGAFRAEDAHPALTLDLAVFPSLCVETYGLVVDEALARGVPVVVSDLGALGERIGKGGIVVPHGSVAALREAIAGVVRDPAARERLVAGIPAEFTAIEDAAKSYARLYLLAEGSARASASARVRATRALRDRFLTHVFPPLLPKEQLQGPVLVLAAHPDDEVIACGGMLAWHARAGHAVTVVHVTDGAKGDPGGRYADIREVRRREGREALRRLGVTDVRSLGLEDGAVPEAIDELTRRLVALFAEIGPKTLYSFFATESHRDHRAVALATALAARSLAADCRVLLYGVNQVVAGGTLFDITALVEQKQHALAAFESQLAYNDFKTKILHRDHAATVNVEDASIQYAELFADVRVDQLMQAQMLGGSLVTILSADRAP